MTRIQSALEAIDDALVAIDQEIANFGAGRGSAGGLPQLKAFRVTLEVMKRQLTSGALPPRNERLVGMGQAIADTWPLDSQPGAVLLAPEHQYLRV